MSISIKPDQFSHELQTIFSQFEHSVETAFDTASKEVSKEAVRKLKASSPTGKSKKKYKNSWKTEKKGGTTVIHNEQYQLTHLLENGHDIVIKGEVRGHAKAQPHIKPVEEWVQEEMPEELKRQVESRV